MKNKTYYPIIIASILTTGALVPIAIGEQKIKKEEPKKVKTTNPAEDKTFALIQQKITAPLKVSNRGRFSRKGPIYTYEYNLVETTSPKSTDSRTFTVKQSKTSRRKSKKTSQPTDFLSLKVSATNQILVQAKDKWIPISEHPITKHLKRFEKKQTAASTDKPTILP